VPPNPKPLKQAEGQLQFVPAPAQSTPPKNAPPSTSIREQVGLREHNAQDRALPLAFQQQSTQAPKPASASATVAVQPAIAMAQDAKATNAELPERAVKALDQDGLHGLMSQDRPIATTATAGSGVLAGVETARHAAHQIATAVVQGNGKATEIALNPEELGRVRLTLSAADGALTLVVLADRPETQDLLRRHIDVLAQEFRDLGYDSVSFSFNADGQSETPDDSDSADEDVNTMIKQSVETEEAIAPVSSSGLDLRL
jgi:flagellar hook-length control protein FliK